MNVKEHYNNHLGKFYSWMIGDFENKKNEFKNFLNENKIIPTDSKNALDLGCGNGIQSQALIECGFKVIAIDFDKNLLKELSDKNLNNIKIINDDIKNFENYLFSKPELIICAGDTISHLENKKEIEVFLSNLAANLKEKGKIVLSFRDYSNKLEGNDRFIPVKSDENKILTCILDYELEKVRVTDLLYEKDINNNWVQKVSSYFKIRISKQEIITFLENANMKIILDSFTNRMINIIAEKNA
ncbi:MAG: class I SAM-dependent methyltransferase [Candidatus Sericytochromatia bacterium]